jgi:hypothetical protein
LNYVNARELKQKMSRSAEGVLHEHRLDWLQEEAGYPRRVLAGVRARFKEQGDLSIAGLRAACCWANAEFALKPREQTSEGLAHELAEILQLELRDSSGEHLRHLLYVHVRC